VHPDLERLIHLQALDSRAAEARRLQTAIPDTQRALDLKLQGARDGVAAAKEQLATNQTDRRALEKDITAVQTRLTRYKDQLMEVKTNREYTAMQHEIDMAQAEVKRMEDIMLEHMLGGDERAAALTAAEAALKTAEQQIVRERADLDRELAAAGTTLEALLAERATLVADIPRQVLALYDTLSRGRKGIAVAQAKDGLCVECHVRLRPQVYSELRQNAVVRQCENCQRILYFVPPTGSAETATAPA
jgi:uncharacterized protein